MNKSITQSAEPKQRFRVGSSYFFGDQGTDIDEIEFEESPKLYRSVMQFRARDKSRCVFKWRKMTPDEFVEYTLNSKLPMEIGKFLVPEIAEFLGFTIEHLKQLAPVVDRLDEKHKYERVIYNAYLENGAFYLTNEQRNEAYEEYMKHG